MDTQIIFQKGNFHMTLDELETGKSAVIETVGGTGSKSLRQHLLDMGIIPGAKVKMIRHAPMGDPLEFRIHDYELTGCDRHYP